VVRRVDGITSVDVCVYIARMEQLETAFHSSEFYQLVVEATEDSLNRALDLFDAPRGVDVSLTGRPSAQSYDEVGAVLLDARLTGPILVRLNSTIRYDTRCYFNVRSKADISQLNLPHGTDN